MATIKGRIQDLLARHSVDADWRTRALKLADETPPRAVFDRHPTLRRLRELDEGWLDKPRGVRLDAIYPALQHVEFAASIQLQLADDALLDGTGPISDFDPLNSVYLMGVPDMDIWYSLVCMPGEAMTRWPVIQCDPSAGDDSEITIAVNLEHFIHQWMCRDGPLFLSPLRAAPPNVANEIIRVMGTVFNINTQEATAALQFTRHHRDSSDDPALASYIDEQTLRQLDRFMVRPKA